MPMHNLSNTELHIWQQQLLDNISSPSDRGSKMLDLRTSLFKYGKPNMEIKHSKVIEKRK